MTQQDIQTEIQQYMHRQLRSGGKVSLDMHGFGQGDEIQPYLDEYCKPGNYTRRATQMAWVRFVLGRMFQPVEGRFSDAIFGSRTYLFITFTFADFKGAQPGMQKVKSSMERWLQRSRSMLEGYFAVTERGSEHGRLHCHGIFLLKEAVDYGAAAAKLCGQWNAGFIQVAKAASLEHAVRYTAKYMVKDAMNDMHQEMWIWRR